MNIRMVSLFSLVVAIAAAVSIEAHAQGPGDLLVTPPRLVFEDSKTYGVLTLVNRGRDTATYQISLVQYRMKTDGEMERIVEPDSGQRFATDLVRFFPRQITIAPGDAQNVRVQRWNGGREAGAGGQPDSGEYRSHLFFRSVPRQKPLQPTAADSSTREFSVQLSAVYGVTVPTIVRIGRPTAIATISDLTAEQIGDSAARVSLKINRSGSASTYGDIIVTLRGADGSERRLTAMHGIAVYVPNAERSIRSILPVPRGTMHPGDLLRVEYEDVNRTPAASLASMDVTLK